MYVNSNNNNRRCLQFCASQYSHQHVFHPLVIMKKLFTVFPASKLFPVCATLIFSLERETHATNNYFSLGPILFHCNCRFFSIAITRFYEIWPFWRARRFAFLLPRSTLPVLSVCAISLAVERRSGGDDVLWSSDVISSVRIQIWRKLWFLESHQMIRDEKSLIRDFLRIAIFGKKRLYEIFR